MMTSTHPSLSQNSQVAEDSHDDSTHHTRSAGPGPGQPMPVRRSARLNASGGAGGGGHPTTSERPSSASGRGVHRATAVPAAVVEVEAVSAPAAHQPPATEARRRCPAVATGWDPHVGPPPAGRPRVPASSSGLDARAGVGVGASGLRRSPPPSTGDMGGPEVGGLPGALSRACQSPAGRPTPRELQTLSGAADDAAGDAACCRRGDVLLDGDPRRLPSDGVSPQQSPIPAAFPSPQCPAASVPIPLLNASAAAVEAASRTAAAVAAMRARLQADARRRQTQTAATVVAAPAAPEAAAAAAPARGGAAASRTPLAARGTPRGAPAVVAANDAPSAAGAAAMGMEAAASRPIPTAAPRGAKRYSHRAPPGGALSDIDPSFTQESAPEVASAAAAAAAPAAAGTEEAAPWPVPAAPGGLPLRRPSAATTSRGAALVAAAAASLRGGRVAAEAAPATTRTRAAPTAAAAAPAGSRPPVFLERTKSATRRPRMPARPPVDRVPHRFLGNHSLALCPPATAPPAATTQRRGVGAARKGASQASALASAAMGSASPLAPSSRGPARDGAAARRARSPRAAPARGLASAGGDGGSPTVHDTPARPVALRFYCAVPGCRHPGAEHRQGFENLHGYHQHRRCLAPLGAAARAAADRGRWPHRSRPRGTGSGNPYRSGRCPWHPASRADSSCAPTRVSAPRRRFSALCGSPRSHAQHGSQRPGRSGHSRM